MTAPQDTAPGAAIYNSLTLPFYDLVVLGISNHLAWRCPTAVILQHYQRWVSAHHLDVGVGTGYYLDRCSFSVADPSITLLDLNPRSLAATARRLQRYQPETVLADVFQPLPLDELYNSVAMTYLLHCLPGSMSSKFKVFERLNNQLRPGGILFGATILGRDVQQNLLGQGLLTLYNATGVFSNRLDDLNALRANLLGISDEIQIEIRGTVALFSARKRG